MINEDFLRSLLSFTELLMKSRLDLDRLDKGWMTLENLPSEGSPAFYLELMLGRRFFIILIRLDFLLSKLWVDELRIFYLADLTSRCSDGR